MNYEAGLLALVLLWVPIGAVYWRFLRENRRIDREYLTKKM